MKSLTHILVLLALLLTLTAGSCGDRIVPSARVHAELSLIPPLSPGALDPIRPGCGDYRLIVTLETDALGAGMRVAGPPGAVDVVWNLSGPGMALSDPPAAPRIFNEDNREIFGVEGNEEHLPVAANFVLLVSGVQAGQTLQLEMGHEGPGSNGTWVTITNARQDPGETLAQFQVTQEYQTASVDLCSSEPMPPLEPEPAPLPPRVLAFFYPWWGTVAEPEPPYTCGGDAFGWVREVDGRMRFMTAHSPIAQDGARTIYTQTACWMQWTDDEGRTGWLYDVTEANFLAEQMQLAHASGIDGFITSVHGDNAFEMDFLQNTVLPVAAQTDFLVAPLYETPEGQENNGWSFDDATDIAQVGGHLRRLVAITAAAPASLRLTDADGVEKVVIFVDPSLLARFPEPEHWAAIRALADEAGVPYALWGGPGAFTQVFLAGFDGVFNDLEVIETYEPALGLSPYELRDERRLAYRATAWTAREFGMYYALPVVPGWGPFPAEPNAPIVPRDYGSPGDDGAYYRVRWEDALENFPHWIVITSWNEWAEATEVEPSQQYPPSRFDYLRATYQYACRWRNPDGDC